MMACSTKGLRPNQTCMTPHQSDGSAVWGGIKLDRWLPSAVADQFGKTVLNNKASDVKNIKVWLDADGDGLFSATTDQMISPQSGVIHNFPTTQLSRTLMPQDAENIRPEPVALHPVGRPVPAGGGRLPGLSGRL